MKYAITLANGYAGSSQYTLSDGTTVVWDGAASPTNDFHYNIAGLVRDDNSFLFNNISRSTAAGNIITMQVQPVGDFCANNNNSVLANDKSGLFWGHDGKLNPDPRTINSACASFTKVTSRTWLVKKTNLANLTVTLKASGGNYPFNGGGWESFMIVADSPADITAGNYKQVIPMTYVNSEHVVNYTFSNEYTYIAFGGQETTTASDCVTCSFSGQKVLNFNKTTWAVGQKVRVNDLGNGFTASIEVLDPDNSIRPRYPRASSQKSQRHLKRGNLANNTNPVTTKVTLSSSAKATFEVFDIDRTGYRYNEVEVYGMCNGQRINPKTSYVAGSAVKSSYNISGPTAFAKVKNGSAAYTAKKGKMLVEFDKAVTEIYIVTKVNYGRPRTGYQTDGFGPMKFSCPLPEPPVNEDGLILTKQGPANVQQCEDIEYTFKINNTNCEAKTVNFSDVIPSSESGLKWIAESLSVNDDAVVNATINSYGGSQNLNIGGLIVPGSSSLTFKASARYDVGSSTSGTVYNQAQIVYNILVANVPTPKTLLSTDAFTTNFAPYPALDINGNPIIITPDYRTKTVVTPVAAIPARVSSSMTFDKSCVSANSEIGVTVSITNPNSFALSNMMVSAIYSDDFTYVANSLSSATISMTSPVIIDVDTGLVSLEDFILPAGTHQITFKVKAPATLDPIFDPVTSEELSAFEVGYDFNSESDNVCLAGAGETEGEDLLKSCTFCYKPASTSGTVQDTKHGITALQRAGTTDGDNWPMLRKGAWTVLESKEKGLVVNRIATTTGLTSITNPIEGMMVYDEEADCLKIFTTKEGEASPAWHCFTTQTCPD